MIPAAPRRPPLVARALALAVLLAATAGLLLATAPVPTARAAAAGSDQKDLDRVQQRIERAESRRDRKRGTERVLSSEVAEWSAKIGRLQGRITGLQQRQDRVQVDLDREQGQLDTIQRDLRAERARLVRLRARLTESRRVLSERLVQLYQTDRPDLTTVVLNSDGFADLVQRGEFLQRIGRQDGQVVARVRGARTDAQRTTARLGRLEDRQSTLTGRIRARRDEVAGVKRELVGTRAGYRQTRAGKTRALRRVRGDRRDAQEDVTALRKEQSKIERKLGLAGGPVKAGSGRYIWPVNGTITSPYCEKRSYSSCHPGLDIGMPMSAPIRAADSGTVAVAGPQGAYGNFTCIKHTARLSTCYAHQSSIGVSVGQRVRKGQVIGRVGSTGRSTGPHLHLEFRENGQDVNPYGYL